MCFCVSELTNCSDMLIIPRVPRDSRRHYACLIVQLRAKNTILQCVLFVGEHDGETFHNHYGNRLDMYMLIGGS